MLSRARSAPPPRGRPHHVRRQRARSRRRARPSRGDPRAPRTEPARHPRVPRTHPSRAGYPPRPGKAVRARPCPGRQRSRHRRSRPPSPRPARPSPGDWRRRRLQQVTSTGVRWDSHRAASHAICSPRVGAIRQVSRRRITGDRSPQCAQTVLPNGEKADPEDGFREMPETASPPSMSTLCGVFPALTS